MRLEEAWSAKSTMAFKEWVLLLASSYANSSDTLQSAARKINVRPAELYATLQLATLDDDLLDEFQIVMPPKTTWLSISSSTREGVLAAIQEFSKPGEENISSPWKRAEAAIEAATGGSVHSRVANLSSSLILHALKKAKDYGLLTDKQKNALQGFARSKKLGKSLTPKQVAYLQILLNLLVSGNAITANSPDGDQKENIELLEALKES